MTKSWQLFASDLPPTTLYLTITDLLLSDQYCNSFVGPTVENQYNVITPWDLQWQPDIHFTVKYQCWPYVGPLAVFGYPLAYSGPMTKPWRLLASLLPLKYLYWSITNLLLSDRYCHSFVGVTEACFQRSCGGVSISARWPNHGDYLLASCHWHTSLGPSLIIVIGPMQNCR